MVYSIYVAYLSLGQFAVRAELRELLVVVAIPCLALKVRHAFLFL